MVSKYSRPRNPDKTLFKKTRECLSVAQRAEIGTSTLSRLVNRGMTLLTLTQGSMGRATGGAMTKVKEWMVFPTWVASWLTCPPSLSLQPPPTTLHATSPTPFEGSK